MGEERSGIGDGGSAGIEGWLGTKPTSIKEFG